MGVSFFGVASLFEVAFKREHTAPANCGGSLIPFGDKAMSPVLPILSLFGGVQHHISALESCLDIFPLIRL